MVRCAALPRSVRLASLALLLLPAAVHAQDRDFLFSNPRVTLSLRAGLAAPAANSDIFDFMSEELVHRGSLDELERADFHAFELQGELAVRVHDRVDVALSVGHSETSLPSEFRGWVGTDDLPITQTTDFARTPALIGLKGYLKDRGRRISRLAWVPYAWSPYLTAGGGLVAYDFKQYGEFVDFETLDVFQTTYLSNGTAPAAFAGAGAELSLGKHLLGTAEARYVWAEADMSNDFVDFNEIDLSGAQLAIGLALRF